jgi:hypothetical protein
MAIDCNKLQQIAETLPDEYGKLNRRKMLLSMLLPDMRDLSVTDKCRLIGFDRATWYRTINTAEFGEDCVKLARQIKGHRVGSILNAFLNNAELGGKQGYGDTRAQIAYLQDVGILAKPEKGETNVNVNVAVVQQKREANIKTGLERFGYTTVSDN